MATAEKSLRQLSEELGVFDEELPVDVALDEAGPVDMDGALVEFGEDGGATVDFGGDSDVPEEVEFGANLAEYIDESDLMSMASELVSLFETDEASRQDWENTYKKGLDNLGLKIEERTEPWPGASAVVHPLLGEAVVKFQAQTIGEIFPAQGPVKSSISGMITPEKEKQAKRVQDYMNYMILNKMPEYRPETERMLFSLPLAGSAFRKVYKDTGKNRVTSMFVPAEDVVVNYAATDIDEAERVTHVMKKSDNDVKKLQASGFYREADLGMAVQEQNVVSEKIDELTGKKRTTDTDTRRTLLEIHTYWDVPGFDDDPTGVLPPYVITIDKTQREVLSIKRNWKEDDPAKNKRQHFVHYEFIPGLGFYGFGLVHLIGGLASGATSLMRQLIDAGTLSNLPGGLKSRDLRTKGDDTPILPGEWRDVDVPSGTIKDNIFALPYKEPSGTLYQLLVNIVEAGKGFASMADLKVADMNQEAPVGTTLAIMERAMKVQSAIQARLHAGLRKEFNMLAEVIATQTDPAYPYEVEEGAQIKVEDFDERIDIIPVSDPNSGTMAQRIMQHQAVLQLASSAPQLYDLATLHRNVISSIGYPNAEKIIPREEEVPSADPISENATILNLGRVQAKEYQDHEAHLKVHSTLLQNPDVAEMLQNSQSGPAIQGTLDAHVREHMGFLYRRQLEQELGSPLPPLGQPIPEDIEKRLSVLAAEASEQLLGKKQAMKQAEENAAMQQDPVIQQKERELAIREADVRRKMQNDSAKMQLELRKLELERELAMVEYEQRREEAGLEAIAEIAGRGQAAEIEGLKIGVQIAEAVDNKKNSDSE